MAKYRKKPVEVEATQWYRNGDHPRDDTTRMQPEIDECEGAVVRSYRRPAVPGHLRHGDHPFSRRPGCTAVMDDHGWIDTMEGGHTVCPGDWIITGVQGEVYPCEPDIFAATYEPVAGGDSQ